MKTNSLTLRTINPNTVAGRFWTACAARLLALLLLLMQPAVVQAQFNIITNNGTITITGYTGSGGAVTIPGMINGLPVTSIGTNAFYSSTNLTNVTIPNSVTNIGDAAFTFCSNLTNVTLSTNLTSLGYLVFARCGSLSSITIPNSVTSIGDYAFHSCESLTSATIGNNASIGNSAFLYCTSLTNVTIGNSASIGYRAFSDCYSLASVYFAGNAPSVDWYSYSSSDATTYYLPGTTGWDDFRHVTGLPTIPWYLPNPTILNFEPSFGVQTNRFGFTISWATNISVVVEACTSFANPVWQPVQTNTLTGGSCYFSDPTWTNYPARFYRLRSP